MKIDINLDNINELIHQALKNKDIKVYYQPKYDALNGKLVGAEALARWIADEKTIISPSIFVPLLETTGLVIELDWYMLDETCRFLSE